MFRIVVTCIVAWSIAMSCALAEDLGADRIDDLIEIIEQEKESAYIAAEVLAHIGNDARKATDCLVEACQSKDDRLRIAAAVALTHVDVENEEALKTALRTLIAALTDEDANIRREAVRGLTNARIATPDQLKMIAKALADGDDFVALHAADAMVEIGERSVPLLIEADDPATRRRRR